MNLIIVIEVYLIMIIEVNLIMMIEVNLIMMIEIMIMLIEIMIMINQGHLRSPPMQCLSKVARGPTHLWRPLY